MPLFLIYLRAEVINIDLGDMNGVPAGVDGQCPNLKYGCFQFFQQGLYSYCICFYNCYILQLPSNESSF